jgi:hypothetical protein
MSKKEKRIIRLTNDRAFRNVVEEYEAFWGYPPVFGRPSKADEKIGEIANIVAGVAFYKIPKEPGVAMVVFHGGIGGAIIGPEDYSVVLLDVSVLHRLAKVGT